MNCNTIKGKITQVQNTKKDCQGKCNKVYNACDKKCDIACMFTKNFNLDDVTKSIDDNLNKLLSESFKNMKFPPISTLPVENNQPIDISCFIPRQ